MNKITEILAQKIAANKQKIDDFFAQKFQESPALFYNSIDLRHSGFKIAPVDTNCFPAGFNNLSEASKEKAKLVANDFFEQNFPQAKKILIIPENHTRNLHYLENVRNLQEILQQKREVVIGTLVEDFKEPTAVDLKNGHSITLHPLTKKADQIVAGDFSADLILLNNDLTDGVPQILKNLTTPIIPAVEMGWHSRTKSHHFDIYNQLAQELAQILEIDSWLISSFHTSHHNIDFKEHKGLEELAAAVDAMLENLRQKYLQYDIKDEPYCYIKADNGTYGIAVWSVTSGAEVLEINKKERNKMNTLKGAVHNTRVMIQEGIKTIDRIEGKIAEPMIYMINAQVVGNLFRVNENRDEKISLNATGASFFDLENLTPNQLQLGLEKNKITTVYSMITRLAALASAIENKSASTIKN
jgi:glutamate--cysteine ligase